MRARAFTAVLFALLVAAAGCLGGGLPAADGGPTGGSTPTDGSTPATGQADADGAVNFWISDEKNDIDDFEHLNVTITKVAFQPADDEGDAEASEEDDDTADEANETEERNETTGLDETGDDLDETENGTETVENATETTDDEAENEDDEDEQEDADDDTDEQEDADDDTDEQEDADDDADEREDAPEQEDGESDDEKEGWIVRDVEDRTVDLTRLQGENATMLGTFDVPNGTYEKVFLYVGEINATLENGESANVKLPSGRLHLNKGFTVSQNSTPDFVFDVTVFEAGKSGKYILKPVASQSGTDVPIRDVDQRRGPPEDAGNADEPNGPPEDAGNADQRDDEGNETQEMPEGAPGDDPGDQAQERDDDQSDDDQSDDDQSDDDQSDDEAADVRDGTTD